MVIRRALSVALLLVGCQGAAGDPTDEGSEGDATEGEQTTTGDLSASGSTGSPGTSSSDSSGEPPDDEDSSSGAASEGSSGAPVGECGDGIPDAGEACDDANDINGDGCDDDCTHTSGFVLWTVTWDGYGDDVGQAIVVDPDGNVIVGGVSPPEEHSNDNQVWVGKFDPDGEEQWYRIVEDEEMAGGFGASVEVAVDGDGNVYALTAVRVDNVDELWLRKYDADGAELWTLREHIGMDGDNNRAPDLAVDGDDNVLVLANTYNGAPDLWLRKLDPEGAEIWTSEDPGLTGAQVAIAGSGEIVVTGASGTDAAIRRYNPDAGQQTWAQTDATLDGTYGAIALDGAGNLSSAKTIDGVNTFDDDVWVARFDASGTQLWSEVFDGDGDYDRAFDVAADADGNTILTGQWTEIDGTTASILALKLDPDGEQVWMTLQHTISGAGNAVTVDPDGYVFVAGRVYGSNADIFIQKIAP